jgi:S1-C subfamily serine protease
MFTDLIEQWSYPDIQRVAKAGLMTGYPDGTFKPQQNITREEMASILSRLLFRDGLFTDILPEIMPSVVLVHAGEWMGSGAFVTMDGHIITNAHVAGDKKELTIVKDGRQNMTARVLAKSADHDLALLKVPDMPLACLKVATKDVERGEHVGLLGSPKGFTDSFTQGQISHPDRYGDKFQTDAPNNPGNSGGPAINERGEMVGVVTSKYVDVAVEGIAFCIHAKYVREFLAQNGVSV